jgi:hypothetical protein
VLAADDFGRLFRSSDSGRNWVPATQGLPSPFKHRTKPVLLTPVQGGPVYALLHRPVHSQRIDTWLYRSDDQGASWTAVRMIPNGLPIEAMSVIPGRSPTVELRAGDRVLRLADRAARPEVSGLRPDDPGEDLRIRHQNPFPTAELDYDDSNIAVLHDNGSFINVNDASGRQLAFIPDPAGGYRIEPMIASPLVPVGSPLAITDEMFPRFSQNLTVPFPFFGTDYSTIYISDNGNITFGADDPGFDYAESPSGFRNGPPRLAAMWDDLDPDSGGQILFNEDGTTNVVTITYENIPQYDPLGGPPDSNSFQIMLHPDGTIILHWDTLELNDGLTGVSPGNGATMEVVMDLSLDTPLSAAADEAAYEWFTSEYWTRRVAERFYHCHEDVYDQLVIFATSDYPYPVTGEVAAFSDLAKNEVDGIGLATFDETAEFGSGGRLLSAVAMPRLSELPDSPNDPAIPIPSLDTSGLDILAEQVGQAWAAYVQYDQDPAGGPDCVDDLRGLALTHWNFYMNSNASVLWGNMWDDTASEPFTTVTEARARYSALDLYLMGLLDAASVPAEYWLIQDHDFNGDCFLTPGFCDPTSPPEIGIVVDATPDSTRHDFAVDDIITCEGARNPATSPSELRQAFILVVAPGSVLDPGDPDLTKVQSYRADWGAYYAAATNGLGSTDTTLNPQTVTWSGAIGNDLRARKWALNVLLEWPDSTLAPERFSVLGTDDKTLLPDTPAGIGSLTPIMMPDREKAEDPGAVPESGPRPALWFYEVWPRDCSDITVIP